MACAHPYILPNQKYGPSYNWWSRNKYYTIPCGYCLNCRIDKRNWLEDACNDEYKHYGYAAFVTFTYDNSTLPWSYDLATSDLVPTLRYKDFQNFIKRFRRTCDYHNLWNNTTCRRDFKLLCVGEYGDEFNRPHWHVLFFGLDYQACEKQFLSSWKNGLIESDPILKGGIRYVLKYLDKQYISKKKWIETHGSDYERPTMRHSTGLGHHLLLSQLDDIKNNNYSYKARHNTRRPLPTYWKNKIFGKCKPDETNLLNEMFRLGLVPDEKCLNGLRYSRIARDDFKRRKAWIREKSLILQARSDGHPVPWINENDSPGINGMPHNINFDYMKELQTS